MDNRSPKPSAKKDEFTRNAFPANARLHVSAGMAACLPVVGLLHLV